MQYLRIQGLSKRYGDQLLFEDIDLLINKGEKVALVASNGSGKSSLVRALADVERADAGEIEFAREVHVEFLMQDPELADEASVLENVLYADNAPSRAVLDYERCLRDPEDREAMAAAVERMDASRAWDYEQRVKETLFRLDLTDLGRTVAGMSGGERKRVALARVLVNEPDFLVLDEPTNHLDLEMIEWLEDFLTRTNLTLLLITHDRYFLERVCTRIVELEDGELHSYSGNYARYLEQKEARRAQRAATVDKARNLMRSELEWVRRMPKARGTKSKARLEAFQDLKRTASQRMEEETLTIDVKPERLGTKIVELHNVSKRYGDRILFQDVHYKFTRRDTVGLVGPNGSGKSTLIRVITGELPPDTGKVVVGETVRFGIYRQEGMVLEPGRTVLNTIRDIADYIPLHGGAKLTAEQLLERFLFPRWKHRVHVSRLSGGERRRLYLLTILMQNPNVLVLDEPTNDLDIMTLNVLEDFLLHFEGVVLVVSHDRYFMDKIVDHVFALDGEGSLRDVPGNYTIYREKLAEEAAERRAAPPVETSAPAAEDAGDGLNYEDRKKVRSLEQRIEKLETRKDDLEARMAAAADDYDALRELTDEVTEVKSRIEDLTLEWMELVD